MKHEIKFKMTLLLLRVLALLALVPGVLAIIDAWGFVFGIDIVTIASWGWLEAYAAGALAMVGVFLWAASHSEVWR